MTPTFETGGATASFDDGITLDSLLSAATADLDRFGANAGNVERAGDMVAEIVDDGVAAFDAASVDALLGSANVLVEALTRTPCE